MPKSISISTKLDPMQLGEIRAEFFKALGDPVRLALVAYMAQLGKPSTVTEVSGCCGIDFSGVSRHLKILREANIITFEKQGRKTYYQINTIYVTKRLRGLSDILDQLI